MAEQIIVSVDDDVAEHYPVQLPTMSAVNWTCLSICVCVM